MGVKLPITKKKKLEIADIKKKKSMRYKKILYLPQLQSIILVVIK